MHKIFAKTLFLGKKVVYLPECHSTNEIAAEMACDSQISEGLLVITDKQTEGKGQRGNSWLVQPGKNLTFTLVLKPAFLKITDQFQMTIVVSMALRQVLSKYVTRSVVEIKWPNDLYINDKKVAGILIENNLKSNKIDNMLVGIGLNVNQVDFGKLNATSVLKESGELVSLEVLLEDILLSIEQYYIKLRNGKIHELRNDYLRHLRWMDEWHRYSSGEEEFNGRIIGVDQLGRLVVQTSDRQRAFDIKDISFLK